MIWIQFGMQRYADDPSSEAQTGNMTWQIPDPRRPEHWRHTENPCKMLKFFLTQTSKIQIWILTHCYCEDKGAYNTDVIDTDYVSWLILLHCSDPESEKKFLSTFVLSRAPYIDKMTTDYLREKIGQYKVPMEYLFPVNQTFCFGESNYPTENESKAEKEFAAGLTPKVSTTTEAETELDDPESYNVNTDEDEKENDAEVNDNI